MDDHTVIKVRPTLFVECGRCVYATSRFAEELNESRKKHGRLNIHRITIDCQGDFEDFKIMWATHYGTRFPTEDLPGLTVSEVMITGGQRVNCPGLSQ